MATYLIRRLAQGIIIMALASLTIYTVLVYIMPLSPYKQYELIRATPAGEYSPFTFGLRVPFGTSLDDAKAARLQQLGLSYKVDRPWPLSFLAWLFDPLDTTEVNQDLQEVPKGIDLTIGEWRIRGSGALTGDFGTSDRVSTDIPVRELIVNFWINTVLLVGAALVVTMLIAIPIGVIAAYREGSRLDHAVTLLTFAFLSIPSFWLGLIFIILLAVMPREMSVQNNWGWLPYLPPGEAVETGKEWDIANRAYHLALPVMTLALIQAAALSRHVRFSMLEVLKADYVRTAWAKGLSSWRVLFKHALRNAFIPLITVLTLMLPSLVTGAIVVETVFNYKGLGFLFFRAVGASSGPVGAGFGGGAIDHSVALTLTLIITAVVVLSNLLADILYLVFDPRVNYRAQT